MKLNKVMALALSGLMAVSMLAGCAGNPDGGDDQGDVIVNPTPSNAADIMNSLQSTVKFEADTTLDAILASALDGVQSKDIKDAPELASVTANITSGSNALYKAVQKKITGEYGLNTKAIDFETACTSENDTTTTNLYWVKAANLSESSVLTVIANIMQMDKYDDVSTVKNTQDYEISYKGAVSVMKASATAEDGTAYSTYVVAVSVTQDVGDKIVNK